jgi:hypothetical protein
MATAYGQQIKLVAPTSINGCQLWFDAADRSTFTFSSGTSISQWNDKSSNKYNVVQPTTLIQPTLTSAAQNGLSGVQFATSTYLYQTATLMPNFTTGSSTSVLIAARNASVNTGWNIINTIWFTSSGSGATTRYHFSFNSNAVDGTTLFANGVILGQVTSNAVAASSNTIFGFTASGTSATIHTNGSTNTYPGVTLPDANSSTAFIFNDPRNLTNTSDNIMIFEMIGFNIQLSSTQREQMEGYLAWKWGMVDLLAANHPYKTNNIWTPVYPALSYTIPATSSNYPLFQPTQLSNCVLWLDAADKTTLFTDSAGTSRVSTSGQIVACWKDKSVSKNNASNTSIQPTASYNAQNGLSVLNFDGTQYLTLSTSTLPTGSTQCSFFFVTRTTRNATQVFFTYGADPNATNRNPQFYYTDSPNPGNVAILSTDTYGAGGLADNTNYQNAYVITSCTFTSVNAAWDNGGAFSGGTTNISLNTGTGWASIGVGRVTSTPNFYLTGQIAEIIVYSRPLSTTERQNIEGYLAWKWGLATNLNAAQPWKTTRFNTLPPFPSNQLQLIIKNKSLLPTNIANNVLWLDAADSTQVIVSGSTVTQWKDKSGQNNNTSSANGSPQYNSSQLNKRAGITLNGSSSYFVIPRVVTDDWSIFIVLSTTQTNAGAGGQWWAGNGIFDAEVAGTSTDFGISLYGSGFATGVGNPPTGDNTIISSTSINTGAGFICGFQRTSSSGVFENFVNGTSQGSTTGGTGSRTTTRITIGALQTLATYFNGVLYEIIAYTSNLSVIQRQSIEGYLAWKWGLQGSLPSTHPYKLFPPPP